MVGGASRIDILVGGANLAPMGGRGQSPDGRGPAPSGILEGGRGSKSCWAGLQDLESRWAGPDGLVGGALSTGVLVGGISRLPRSLCGRGPEAWIVCGRGLIVLWAELWVIESWRAGCQGLVGWAPGLGELVGVALDTGVLVGVAYKCCGRGFGCFRLGGRGLKLFVGGV